MKTVFLALLLCLPRLVSRLEAAEPLGLSLDQSGNLLLEGRPFRGVGVNYYDAFARTLALPSRTNYDEGFRILSSRGIPFARFSAGGYWPVDWGLYQTNRAGHFARLDALVRSAEKHGLGLIPSFFWLISTVPDLVGEPCNQWGNPASKTQAFMREYTHEVVMRYRGSKAIWAWEFGNEYNLPADLPNAADHRPPVQSELGTPSARSATDDLTHDAFRTALAAFAREVRQQDPRRLIISGNAFPRISAWHQKHDRSWTADSTAQFAEMLLADNPDPVDSISLRLYEPSDASRFPQALTIGAQARKLIFVGEFGVPGIMTTDSSRRFQDQIHLLEQSHISLAALWVFDFDGQADNWNVTSANSRSEQLEAIVELNRRLRSKP